MLVNTFFKFSLINFKTICSPYKPCFSLPMYLYSYDLKTAVVGFYGLVACVICCSMRGKRKPPQLRGGDLLNLFYTEKRHGFMEISCNGSFLSFLLNLVSRCQVVCYIPASAIIETVKEYKPLIFLCIVLNCFCMINGKNPKAITENSCHVLHLLLFPCVNIPSIHFSNIAANIAGVATQHSIGTLAKIQSTPYIVFLFVCYAVFPCLEYYKIGAIMVKHGRMKNAVRINPKFCIISIIIQTIGNVIPNFFILCAPSEPQTQVSIFFLCYVLVLLCFNYNRNNSYSFCDSLANSCCPFASSNSKISAII